MFQQINHSQFHMQFKVNNVTMEGKASLGRHAMTRIAVHSSTVYSKLHNAMQ